jgi:hypothetical protein
MSRTYRKVFVGKKGQRHQNAIPYKRHRTEIEIEIELPNPRLLFEREQQRFK